MSKSGDRPAGGPATRLVRGPTGRTAKQEPVTLPIAQTTTFVIDDALNDAFDRGDYRSEYLYTRHSNPTIDELQWRLVEAHAAEDGVVTASGMAAVSAAFVALTKPGDTVIADTLLYGATNTFLSEYLRGMGREVVFVPLADGDALSAALAAATSPALVYGETLANPLVQALPLPDVVARAHAAGALVVVDNTFANPLLCRPLEHGADVVVESLSKSIAGHSDVHGGFVAGRAAEMARVWHAMVHFGGCIDPHAAWLVWRGLKTMAMRTETAQSNAGALAAALREDARVTAVHYADAAAANADWLAGPGAMLSIEVVGGNEAAHRFMDRLRVFTPATSLGGVESLVSLPYNTSHRTAESQERIGLRAGTVRISVGCEDEADLVADALQALG